MSDFFESWDPTFGPDYLGDDGELNGQDPLPADDGVGGAERWLEANPDQLSSGDRSSEPSTGFEEAAEDSDPVLDTEGLVAEGVGPVSDEPSRVVVVPVDLGDAELDWWTGSTAVSAELLETWPAAAPGFEPGVLSDPWTSGFGLDPVPGFADPSLLGAAEPLPSGPVEY